MSVGEYARLLHLLMRVAMQGNPKGPEARSEVNDLGWHLDRYDGGDRGGTLILLHGFNVRSSRDHRLVNFARELAGTQKRVCLVPRMPGLSQLLWDPGDIKGLEALVDSEFHRTGRPVGLFGFSIAGSYALLVAANPALAEKVRFVIAVGAYHDANLLHANAMSFSKTTPQTEEGWSSFLYQELVAAYRHADSLPLTPTQRTTLNSLLDIYCELKSLEEPRAFYETYLRSLDLLTLEYKERDQETLAFLSPKNKLAGLRAPVGLLHDPNDFIVPKAQVEALYREIQSTPYSIPPRLLLSPLLSHVGLSGILKLRELSRLCTLLLPIVRD